MKTGVTPTEALDSQVSLIRALRHPEHGVRLTGALFKVGPEMVAREVVYNQAKSLASKLDRAATILITDTMLRHVLRRMDSVEFGQPLAEGDLPFESGYILLPREVTIPADDDPDLYPLHRETVFDSGGWFGHEKIGSTSPVGHLEAFNPSPTDGLAFFQGIRRSRLKEATKFLQGGGDEEVAPEIIEEGNEVLLASGMKHVPIYLGGWEYGRSWDPQYREEGYVLTAAGEFERRFWLTLWRTLSEEIVVPVRMPRRPTRQAARVGLVPEVVVAELRRVRRPNHDQTLPSGEVVMWTHRWRVREHTRTLHRGTPQEKVVPVRSYVKGPENRPLIEKDLVYRLGR